MGNDRGQFAVCRQIRHDQHRGFISGGIFAQGKNLLGYWAALSVLGKLQKLRIRLFALCLGGILGIIVAVIAMLLMGPGQIPELNASSFNQALNQWGSNRLMNYEIEITVQGRQPGRYRTTVQDGEVVSAEFNNNALTNPRTMSTWTVDGMFRTIDYDVQAQLNRDAQDPELTLRAEFNPQYGYPQKYQRIQWGSLNELTWEVTRFEITAPAP